jgi:hypothetical protein
MPYLAAHIAGGYRFETGGSRSGRVIILNSLEQPECAYLDQILQAVRAKASITPGYLLHERHILLHALISLVI